MSEPVVIKALITGTHGKSEAKKEEDLGLEPTQMHEKIKRPRVLPGETYYFKPPWSEHAFYVTINDILLDEGTQHEHRRPFEIFINSKNMEYFVWIVALTRMVSAVFRNGGNVSFVVEELAAIFDPRGGYMQGSRRMPSVVAELGYIVEEHLHKIGYAKRAGKLALDEVGDFPTNCVECPKCHHIALVVEQNCEHCLNCPYDRCESP